MPSRPRISVCMAAYNGSAHIREQLDSIFAELNADDEVIVVDDGSTDGTRELLSGLTDPRLRVVLNDTNLGYVRNFEKALELSTGDIIMLSDQDDIWIPGRVDMLVAALRSADAAVGNCAHFGGTPGYFQQLRVHPRYSTTYARNLLGILVGYRLHWGSAMAVTKSLLEDALPFPAVMTESHDQWLGMVANVRKSVAYLSGDTVQHRLHDANLTPKKPRSFRRVLRARAEFCVELAIAVARTRSSSRAESGPTRTVLTGGDHRTATAAVVSAFNPDSSLSEHVDSLLDQVDHVVVVDDGSTRDVSAILAEAEARGATVIRLAKNSGIAAALNAGIRHARLTWDPAWIMTMDQDSRLTPGYVDSALGSFASASHPERVAAICAASHNGLPLPTMTVDGEREIFDPMQSGSLYRTEIFDSLGYLEEGLFIDCVDSEFNARLRDAGLHMLAGEDCDLVHSLGKSRPMSILGWHAHIGKKKLYIYEHAPFRVYYITRNSLTLARRYVTRQPVWVARRISMEIQSNIIRFVFGPHRVKNAIAAAAGLRDAAAGRQGPIPATVQRRLSSRS